MAADCSFRFPSSLAGAVAQCWKEAAAPAEWNVTPEQFQRVLERSAASRFSGMVDAATAANAKAPDVGAIELYLGSLHVADLALACACSAGNATAWDFFVVHYRPELYRAARAIAGAACAREFADSLYAELFGLHESGEGGRRNSLFHYFHGRSKLGTWLRAVLAQRHVDEFRRARRTEPFEEIREERILPKAEGSLSAKNLALDPERDKYLAILQTALTAVLEALDRRDRLRLAYYYADGLTLAEIGKLLGEHEATVSRKLERTRRHVRQHVEVALRYEKKFSEAQLLLCVEYARGEWPFDLTAALSGRD
jgi:RNA polymerase sigma-70 factor (ECF subfamily)